MSKTDQVILVAGLGYGDEGKGTMVDYFVRKYNAHTVVRYNGGAQAAHNVITPEGKHHTFAQFGSGTFVPGVHTYLSRYMLVNPLGMVAEESHLQVLGVADVFARTAIDGEALIITPFQVAVNRLLELSRGNSKHGSCGMGIGQTMQDFLSFGNEVLFAKDLLNKKTSRKKLQFIRQQKLLHLKTITDTLPDSPAVQRETELLRNESIVDRCAEDYFSFARLTAIVGNGYLENLLRQEGTVVFEGAQGVLLDQRYGFFPYNTWTDTTFANAEALLQQVSYQGTVRRIGVLRGYATRHGAGPFVTEDKTLTAQLPDYHNGFGVWQENFRVGHFDLVAARYALEVVGGADELVLTCLDRLEGRPEIDICIGYTGIDASHSEYFGYKNNAAVRILVPEQVTNTHQAAVSNSLQRATPLYEKYEGGIEGYVKRLQTLLNTPINTLSFGKTSEDKRDFHTLCLQAA